MSDATTSPAANNKTRPMRLFSYVAPWPLLLILIGVVWMFEPVASVRWYCLGLGLSLGVALTVVRVCYELGGETWLEYSDGVRSFGGSTFRVSDLWAEYSIAVLAGLALLTQALLRRDVPMLDIGYRVLPVATVAAVIVTGLYCWYIARRGPPKNNASPDDRSKWASGYRYYWVYSTILVVWLAIATVIQVTDWYAAMAEVGQSTATMKERVEVLAGLGGQLDSIPAKAEAVVGEYLNGIRLLFNALLLPVIPFVGMLAILYLFKKQDGYAKSFASGGAFMMTVFAVLVATLTVLGTIQVFEVFSLATSTAHSGLLPIMDGLRGSDNSEAVKRANEILEMFQHRSGLAGFLRTVTEEQGVLYLAAFAIQILLTQFVMAVSKGRASRIQQG